MTTVEIDTVLEAIGRRLSATSAEHSVRVGDAAAWLADLYGVDTAEARVAGLLHDWCRDLSATELVRLAEARRIPITPVDMAAPYLLHAPLAGILLAERFPELSDNVLSAIAGHTYGSENMDELGMVVYIADTIEPGRTHAGVDELREAAGAVPLRELFIRTYSASMRHLVDGRRVIHPGSVATWNANVAGER